MSLLTLESVFKSGLEIFSVREDLIAYDIEIVFLNQGFINDIKKKLYGFQHLLEHAILDKKIDHNININGYTSENVMGFNMDVDKQKIDYFLLFIKSWLFKDEDNTKINFSIDLNNKEITNLISILDNEDQLRNDYLLMNWNLLEFLLTNGEVYYSGGNYNSLTPYFNNVVKNLKSDNIIPPQHVKIFIKKNKKFIIPYLEKMLFDLKPVIKKNLVLNVSKSFQKHYSKIIQIGNGHVYRMVFNIPKLNFKSLFILNVSFQNIYIIDSESLDQHVVFIVFPNKVEFYQFYNEMINNTYNFLNNSKKNDIHTFRPELINSKCLSFINYLYSIPVYKIKEKYFSEILAFFQIISQNCINGNIIGQLGKHFAYDNETRIDLEKYTINDFKLDYDFFYSKKNLQESTDFQIVEYKTKCSFNPKVYKFVQLHDNVLYYKHNVNFSYIDIYPIAFLAFFLSNEYDNFSSYFNEIINNKSKEMFMINTSNMNFKNSVYYIKSECEFIFLLIKKNKIIPTDVVLVKNIFHILREKGLIYEMIHNIYSICERGYIFFFIPAKKIYFKKIVRTIESLLTSEFINYSKTIVVSEKVMKGERINFKKLEKKIVIKI